MSHRACQFVWTPENPPTAASRVGSVRACQCTIVHKNKRQEHSILLIITSNKYKFLRKECAPWPADGYLTWAMWSPWFLGPRKAPS